MNRLLRLPLNAPRITLAAMLAITAVLGFYASRIRVDSSIENLLPADDPDKRYYNDVKTVFGDEEIAVIGVFASDVFAPATLAKIDQLSTRLAALDGVHEVLSLTTVKGLEMTDFGLITGRVMRTLPRTVEEGNAFRARVLGEPLYLKNVVSADGRAAGITLAFDSMTDEEFIERGIEGRIRELVAEAGGPEEYAITGIPTIKVHGARMMEGDTQKFTPLSLLLVIVVLAFAFRTPRGVIVPLSTVIIGVVWTTGVMVLMNTPINMGTVVLNPLLMVIGVAAGIHIVSEYYLELAPGLSSREVVERAMRHVSMPVLIAAATTLIGFGSLILTPIRAVREFGIYSVFGIAVVVLAAFTVAPAALTLWPLPKTIPAPHEERGGWLPRVLQAVGAFSVRNRLAVLACSALAIALAFWGISRIQVETDYIGFFSERSFVRTDNALIAERLAGTQPIYVVIDGDAHQSVAKLETLTAMQELQDFIGRQPGVDKAMSLLDYLRIVRSALQPGEGALPRTQAEVDQILMLLDPKDVRAVVNRDFSRANIIVRTKLSRSSDVSELVQRVEAFAADRFPRGIQVRPTGTMVLLNRSADALAWGQLTGLWQELVVLLCLLTFIFLSVRVGVMALIPNVVPAIILYGIMGWVGISLNISTSMIAAIAIGIAIDDTIHLLSGFNTEMRKTGSQERAILAALGSVGQSAFFIATALSAGFFIVCLSSFKPVQHFGLLAGITMVIALVVELFLTPALVTTTRIITVWDLLFLKLGPEPHKQIRLFAGLRPLQAKLVVLMGRLEAAPRGTFIARRGEVKEELYVLLNGRMEVRRGDGGPPIRILTRGDCVGEMGLVRQRARSADVVAVEDTDYLVLDKRFLQRIRRQYPRTATLVFLNLTRILSDRLESTTDALTAPVRSVASASS